MKLSDHDERAYRKMQLAIARVPTPTSLFPAFPFLFVCVCVCRKLQLAITQAPSPPLFPAVPPPLPRLGSRTKAGLPGGRR
jgi:hypothetical protein